MGSLQESINLAKARRDAYYRVASQTVTKAVGSIYGAAASGPFSTLAGDAEARQSRRQYSAAMTGIPYIAIRPIAAKVAAQPLRVGVRENSATPNSRQPEEMRHKRLLLKQSMPDQLFKAMGEGLDTLEEHPLLDVLERPNDNMTAWSLMFCTVFSMYATGKALWWMDLGPDGRVQVYYIPSHWAEPIHLPGRAFAAWKIKPPETSGEGETVPGDLIAYFPMPDPSDPNGAFAPMQAGARAINTDDKLTQSQYEMMSQGIRPSVVIKAGRLEMGPGFSGQGPRPVLTPEQRRDLVEAVKLAYAGANKHGEPLIVDGLIEDVQPWSRTPVEMDYPQGAQMTESRIMKMIGTNPVLAGSLENANRASAWVADYVNNTVVVNPIITLISQVMTQKVAPIFALDGQRLAAWLEPAKAFDPDLQLRRVSLVKDTMTVNEKRRWAQTGELDLEPLPDGDETPGERAERLFQQQQQSRQQQQGDQGGGTEDKPAA